MVRTHETSVTIVGAGIVGLTTALQLHAAGFTDVHIFEKVKKLEPLGVGIGIQAGASLVFRDLGLLPALQKMGVADSSMILSDRWGNLIHSLQTGEASDAHLPHIMVHRGELQMMLLDAVRERLGESHVHADHAISHFKDAGDKTIANFISHDKTPAAIPSRESDVIICADGINSTVRAHLYPHEGPALFSGRSIWRGAVWRNSELDGTAFHFLGHTNKGFLSYPISHINEEGKHLMNWVCFQRTRPADDPDKTPPSVVSWNETAPKGELIREYDGWKYDNTSLRELIESTSQIWVYPMIDRDPLERWSFGRLTLIGDAAHPMYPIGGNGATQGIMDAESLVRHLVDNEDVPTALRAYEAERLPVTSKIVLANRGTTNMLSITDKVHDLAPEGFNNIHDVISEEEIENLSRGYQEATGNEASMVKKKAEKSEGKAERLGLVPPAGWC